MKTTVLSLLLLFAWKTVATAQHISFGVQFIGLSYHLKKSKHSHLFKGKITRNGRLMVNGGVLITARYSVNPSWGVQFSQAIVAHDCSGRFLGMSHLGIFGRKNEILGSTDAVNVSFGPMFFYRQNWEVLPGYVNEGLFDISKNQRWMTKFIWHGGILSWQHQIGPGQYFQLELLPGVPELITIGPGVYFPPGFSR